MASTSNLPQCTLFPSGTLVSLRDLRNNHLLNGRVGTVFRSPAGTAPLSTREDARHIVYLHATDTEKSAIVRSRHGNLARVHNSPLALQPVDCALRVESFPLKLNVLHVYAISSLSINPGYYAFGNTPPTYVLSGISPQADSASILLLASGDLRSALYSLACDDPGRRRAKTRYSFFVNDAQPAVIARNILLLWLMLHRKVGVKLLFSICFSLRLSATAYGALCDAVHALIGPDSNDHLDKIGISFAAPSDWHAVRAVLSQWLNWQDDLMWPTVCAMREEYVKSRQQMSVEQLANSTSAPAVMKYSASYEKNFPQDAAMNEIKAYYRTGIVKFEEDLLYTNPTLFLRPNEYNLHYGSNPYSAFPPFASSYDRNHPLRNMCVSELQRWIDALTTHAKNVSWIFSTADCMVLSTNLSRKYTFDVIATSNVADHVGLLPLLQTLRGLTAPGGVLLTQSLRYSSYSNSVPEYLERNLFVPTELCEAILGWRCLGYSGKCDPEHGGVLFNVPSLLDLMISKLTETGCRAELNLKWVPARMKGVPLDCNEEIVIPNLMNKVRPLSIPHPLFPNLYIYKALQPWSYVHPLTLLPILATAAGSEDLLTKYNDCADVVELLDIVRCMRDGRIEDLCVATLCVPLAAVEDVCSDEFAWQSELRILLDEGVSYSSLNPECDEGTNDLSISWIMLRRRLRTAHVVRVKALSTVIAAIEPSAVEMSAIDKTAAPCWLFPASERNGQTGLVVRRKENVSSCEIKVRILDEWRRAANGGQSFYGIVADACGRIKMGIGKCVENAIFINAPGPLYADEIVQGVRDGDIVRFTFSRGRYELSSVIHGADSWLDDWHSWVPMRKVDQQYMITVSGAQMSDEEKFISRSREAHLIPPLIALKDTLLFFFQVWSESVFYLAYRSERNPGTPDVQALVAHHGIRRDHLTGIPAADVSICFMTHSMMHDLMPWIQEKNKRGNVRTIWVRPDELELLKKYWHVFTMRLKDGPNARKEPPRNAIRGTSVRKHFQRSLITPLFSPSILETFSRKLAGTKHERGDNDVKSAKELGMKLVKSHDYKGAIEEFRRAIVAALNSRGAGAIDHRLVSTCYLNIAHCLLQSGEEADACEVIVCCDAALEYLQNGDEKLLAKAKFRKERAHEILRDLQKAKSNSAAQGKHSEETGRKF